MRGRRKEEREREIERKREGVKKGRACRWYLLIFIPSRFDTMCDIRVTCIAYISPRPKPARKSFVTTGEFDFSQLLCVGWQNFAALILFLIPLHHVLLCLTFFIRSARVCRRGISRHRSLRANRKFAQSSGSRASGRCVTRASSR